MIFLNIFLILCLKTTKATTKSFKTVLSQTPISLVFFHSKGCLPCNRINTILDNLVDKFSNSIRMVTVDSQLNPELTKKYNIEIIPSILVFRGDHLSGTYDGEWSNINLVQFCEKLINSEIKFINSTFELFKFQNLLPSNIIINDPELSLKAENLLIKFGGIVQIGLIDNSEIIHEYKLPKIQFSRPKDNFRINLTEISIETIQNLIKSPYHHLSNQELINEYSTKNTLIVLYDENDLRHIHDISNNFNFIYNFFNSTISYITIDFFKAQNLINQFQIVSFLNPIYIYISKDNNKNKIMIYQKILPSSEDLLNWLKQQILNIQPPQDKNKIGIPRLLADDFIPKALNPNKDIILLISSPGMKGYKDCIQMFNILVQLFEPYHDKIELYEFDISTEHVQGLSLPNTNTPQISVWPATPEKQGSTFTALASLPVILDSLVQVIKTEFTQSDVEEMALRLQDIISNLS